jgi:hypothetical protein
MNSNTWLESLQALAYRLAHDLVYAVMDDAAMLAFVFS